jgi:hypothetical protein
VSVAATVHALARASWGDRLRPAWRVTVVVGQAAPQRPCAWLAFHVADEDGRCPLRLDERVTVPVQVADGHVVAHRAGGDVRVRMLGTADDADAPLY